jgi:hypothetical protein
MSVLDTAELHRLKAIADSTNPDISVANIRDLIDTALQGATPATVPESEVLAAIAQLDAKVNAIAEHLTAPATPAKA